MEHCSWILAISWRVLGCHKDEDKLRHLRKGPFSLAFRFVGHNLATDNYDPVVTAMQSNFFPEYKRRNIASREHAETSSDPNISRIYHVASYFRGFRSDSVAAAANGNVCYRAHCQVVMVTGTVLLILQAFHLREKSRNFHKIDWFPTHSS